jgi:hypothetical protein
MSRYIALCPENEVEIENAVVRGELVAWRHDGHRQWYCEAPQIRGVAPEPLILGGEEIDGDTDDIEAAIADAQARYIEARQRLDDLLASVNTDAEYIEGDDDE